MLFYNRHVRTNRTKAKTMNIYLTACILPEILIFFVFLLDAHLVKPLTPCFMFFKPDQPIFITT